MKTSIKLALLAAGLSAAATASAQTPPPLVGHYIPGVEGVLAGTLPPEGIYVRDYNYVYWANRLNNPDGSQSAANFNAVAYANVPRVIWMTGKKVLGADFGMDVLLPLVYKNITVNGVQQNHFSAADLCVEPVLLSWHGKQYDLAAGYAFYAPTADMGTIVNSGQGFWTQMLTFGGTWYADSGKTWSVSVLNRYEFNSLQRNTGIRPGQVYTLEYGIAKALTPAFKFGVAGYYQTQTTLDSGGPYVYSNRDSVAAVGPELTYDFPKIMLFTSLRYEREFFANDRPQGNVVTLTLTKKF